MNRWCNDHCHRHHHHLHHHHQHQPPPPPPSHPVTHPPTQPPSICLKPPTCAKHLAVVHCSRCWSLRAPLLLGPVEGQRCHDRTCRGTARVTQMGPLPALPPPLAATAPPGDGECNESRFRTYVRTLARRCRRACRRPRNSSSACGR